MQAGIEALETEERKVEADPIRWYDLSPYILCRGATDLLRFDSPLSIFFRRIDRKS